MSNTSNINSTTQLDNSFRFEQTWFFPQKKQLVSLFTRIVGFQILPILFNLDLTTLDYTQTFPLSEEDNNSLTEAFSNIKISSIKKAAITYNTVLKKYLITYIGLDGNTSNPQPFVINLKVTDWDLPKLESVDIYKDTTSFQSLNTPPVVLDVNNSLVFPNTPINTTVGPTYLPIFGYPTSCNIVSKPQGTTASITNDGFITVTIPSAGIYHFNFSATNNVGTTYYTATFTTAG